MIVRESPSPMGPDRQSDWLDGHRLARRQGSFHSFHALHFPSNATFGMRNQK
jgi:hypothetical protein